MTFPDDVDNGPDLHAEWLHEQHAPWCWLGRNHDGPCPDRTADPTDPGR